MVDDYVNFFEKRAFEETDENVGCYCVWNHWTPQKEQERANLPPEERRFVKRDFARKLILEGKLNGFAAYCGDKMAGFCNADDKRRYFRLQSDEREKTMAIVCFTVDRTMRGKGIATALLEAVCQYAGDSDFDRIEAYPSENIPTHCGGSASMFLKQGFSLLVTAEGTIAEKKLK